MSQSGVSEGESTGITKVSGAQAPRGPRGQKQLAGGTQVAMRMWENEAPTESKPLTKRDYETVGYVLSGRAELHIAGERVLLEPGDSWVVPRGAVHTYQILEAFTAIEAISPPEPAPEDRPEPEVFMPAT